MSKYVKIFRPVLEIVNTLNSQVHETGVTVNFMCWFEWGKGCPNCCW